MAGRTEPIETKDVAIKTASVEIKVLTLSGKQVTLAVYRQLPKLDATLWWAHDRREQAEPWGIVNYCPDCPPAIAAATGETVGDTLNPSHLHLVWEVGGKLYRTAILEPREDLRFLDPVKGINYDLTEARPYVWWEDLNEACARYAELLRLDQLFIAV